MDDDFQPLYIWFTLLQTSQRLDKLFYLVLSLNFARIKYLLLLLFVFHCSYRLASQNLSRSATFLLPEAILTA